MEIIYCKECEFFTMSNNTTSRTEHADTHCSNTAGLLKPGPNDFCSRAKKSNQIQNSNAYDEAMLAKLYAQRRG